jgi:PTH1 family peptidyl-tRNA hydrolase
MNCQTPPPSEDLTTEQTAPSEQPAESSQPSPSAEKAPQRYLIVGLGNPGREYANNRHNVGFWLVDRLAAQLNTTFSRLQERALVTSATYKNQRLILAKPQTFMNQSGQSVAPLWRYYRLPIDNLLVIYDDLDIPQGVIRLRARGSSGGHHGMRSIIERLGRSDFPRLRIGIGRPPGRMDPAAYVLQDFSTEELEQMEPALARALEAVLTFITQGIEVAMTRFNQTNAID